MPPRGKGRAAAQPLISTAMRRASRTTRNPRIIQTDSENSDLDDDDCVEEQLVATPPTKRPRGRPRKTQPNAPSPPGADPKPLFDTSYEESTFSLTIEKKSGHIPMVWFNGACDYLEEKATLYDASTEVGPKAGHVSTCRPSSARTCSRMRPA